MARCEYKTIYSDLEGNSIPWECPHPAINGKNEDDGKRYCIFHSRDEDKDIYEFYDRFREVYNTNEHIFIGFVFPKDFDFKKTISEEEVLKFNNVNFYDAEIKGQADFKDTEFSGGAYFRRATFSGEAFFIRATFSKRVSFREATFSGHSYFDRARFLEKSRVIFRGETFKDDAMASFQNMNIEEKASLSFNGVNLNRVRFLRTDLERIEFKEVYWTNEKYKSKWNWKRKMIYDDTFQSGTIIKRKGNKDHYPVYQLYNQLIKNYESTNRHHEAGDFFAGMMDMRRRGSFDRKIFSWIMLHFYKATSEYGERPIRVLGWIILLLILFSFIYKSLGIAYSPDSSISYIKDLCNGFMVSFDVLTLGRIKPLYQVVNKPIVPFLKGIQTFFGAILLPLFILAVNRKFRRTKD